MSIAPPTLRPVLATGGDGAEGEFTWVRLDLCPIKWYSDMDANSLSEQVPFDHTQLAGEQVTLSNGGQGSEGIDSRSDAGREI